MKKVLILISVMGILTSEGNAQWSGSTNETTAGSVGIGTTNLGTDKLKVATGGQYVRVGSWGLGITDSGWRNTFTLSNNYDYHEIYNNDSKPLVFQHQYGGNIGIGIIDPLGRLDIKIKSDESSVKHLRFLDGDDQIGSFGPIATADGIGLSFSAYTNSNITTAEPTLVLSAFTNDITPNNNYDAAVSIRGYDVSDNSTLQNLPIFKVMNGHSSAYLTVRIHMNSCEDIFPLLKKVEARRGFVVR